jgi:hypothetical protein
LLLFGVVIVIQWPAPSSAHHNINEEGSVRFGQMFIPGRYKFKPLHNKIDQERVLNGKKG